MTLLSWHRAAAGKMLLFARRNPPPSSSPASFLRRPVACTGYVICELVLQNLSTNLVTRFEAKACHVSVVVQAAGRVSSGKPHHKHGAEQGLKCLRQLAATGRLRQDRRQVQQQGVALAGRA